MIKAIISLVSLSSNTAAPVALRDIKENEWKREFQLNGMCSASEIEGTGRYARRGGDREKGILIVFTGNGKGNPLPRLVL